MSIAVKITLTMVVILALSILVVVLIGKALPVKHQAQRSVVIEAGVAQVWAMLTHYSQMPQWRVELVSVEKISAAVWLETDKSGKSSAFITTASVPEQTLVRTIVGEDLMFGGSWTFELRAQGSYTQLTITENGEVYNPLFRFVAKYIMGYNSSMDKFLGQLQLAL